MDENNNPFAGPMLPLSLLAATAILFLMAQNASIDQGTDVMKWQSTSADNLLKKLAENKTNLEASVEKSKPLVAQSEQSQKQFLDLMKELNEIAVAGDKDAKLIIDNYGIKVADQPPAEEGKKAGETEKKPE